MTCGYRTDRRAVRTKETFQDGWVYTGAEVYVNGTNELFVVDRIKASPFVVRTMSALTSTSGLNQGQGFPRSVVHATAIAVAMLTCNTYPVAPPELEGHILELKDVSDVCIVGRPDEYSGEVPFAFIVPSAEALERIKRDPTEAEKIKAAVIKVCETYHWINFGVMTDMRIKHVADNKVHFKRLAGGVEFIDVIPRNPSGKLLRRVLRDRLRAQQVTKAKL